MLKTSLLRMLIVLFMLGLLVAPQASTTKVQASVAAGCPGFDHGVIYYYLYFYDAAKTQPTGGHCSLETCCFTWDCNGDVTPYYDEYCCNYIQCD
jgi:hypothetical protein